MDYDQYIEDVNNMLNAICESRKSDNNLFENSDFFDTLTDEQKRMITKIFEQR